MSYKKFLNKKTILVILPVLLLLIATLIAVGITNAAGNTAAPETEQTFTEEGDGYYIWVRAVDHAGNKGPWSEGQQVCIDINEPKVSAKNSSVTITKGDKVAMSTYFTTDKNGNAVISSTTYKIGSTSYTNTSSLAVGTYTVTCTVTKVTGKQQVQA